MSTKHLRFLRIIIILLIISNVATITILVVHFNQDRHEKMINKLDLTEEQTIEYKNIRSKYRDMSKPNIDTLRKYQAELLTLVIEKANDSLIDDTENKIVARQKVLLQNILGRYQETRAMLNPTQQAILDSCYYEKFQCPMHLFRNNRHHGLLHNNEKIR